MIRTLAAAALLATAAAFAEDPVRVLHVLVTQAGGEPVAGVEVRCMPQHHQGLRTDLPADHERGITNESGIVSFVLMIGETHIVDAWHGELGAAVQHYFSRDEEQFVVLSLEPARLVTGRIMDPRGHPLEGVRILAFRGIPLGETDADGRYAIRTLGRLGMPDSWLYKPGHAAQSFTFAFNFGSYDIVLPPGDVDAVLAVQVLPSYGAAPPPRAVVEAIRTPTVEAFAEARETATRGQRGSNWVPARIAITDADGTPLPNVGLWVADGPSAIDSGMDGAIELWHAWDGPVTWRVTRAYGVLRLFIGSFNNHLQYEEEVPIISQEMTAETPADLLNLRVVVERPTFRHMLGRVLDDTGEPVRAQVKVLTDGFPRPSPLVQVRDGWFMIRDLPDGPFALEIQQRGHQPRALASGIHFEPGEELEVILERGPFPPRTSIWTAVTGQPATLEAVHAFPGGEQIRAQERYYRQQAAESRDAPARPARPEPPFPVRVVDGSGEPVREIFVQAMQPQGMPFPAFHEARPDPDGDVETMRSDDGHYGLPSEYALIWAEGMGWELYFREHRPGDETRTLVLHPPARITVTVRDAGGNPVPGALVGPPSIMQHVSRSPGGPPSGLEQFGVRTTDANGRVDLGEWPVDFQDFSAARGVDRRQLASAYVHPRPGETSAVEIVLPPWPEGSGAAILDEWRGQRGGFLSHTGTPPDPNPLGDSFQEAIVRTRREVVPYLRPGQRDAIAQELVQRIRTAPGAITQSNMHFYASVALVLEVREAAEPLFQWLQRVDSRHHGRVSPRSPLAAGSLQRVLKAIILLGGGDADGFARLAADPAADPAARVASVVGLGMMGTDESVAAWRTLRATMQGRPRMPARSPDDTHEDRMTEAIALTMFVVPALGEESAARDGALPIRVHSVDENYEFGFAGVGGMHSGYTYITLRRFGEDWLVVFIGMTAVA